MTLAHAGRPYTFKPQQKIFDASNTSSVAAGDVDGDGRDDLVAVSSNQILFARQKPDGTLAPPVSLESPSSPAWGVRIDDLDGDGKLELLAGTDAGLAVLRWNGSTFAVQMHAGDIACRGVVTGDIDGDGAQDAFCYGLYAEYNAMVFYNDRAGGFAAPVHMLVANNGQVQLKDATGDGKPDILLAGNNSFYVYPNNGDRTFQPAIAYPYTWETYNDAIEAFDADHDGKNEVYVTARCNSPCSALHTWRLNDHGYLEDARKVTSYDLPSSMLATDVDADGIEDLVVAHPGWMQIGMYKGEAQGLSSRETLALASLGFTTLAAADLNHDGNRDVAFFSSTSVSVLYGGRAVATDFDKDLKSDLYWHNVNTGANVFWSSGDAKRARQASAVGSGFVMQASGDFDGDGYAEIFVRNRVSGDNQFLASNYGRAGVRVASQDWQAVGAGDFDGDGRSDLVWRHGRTGANTIWLSGDPTTLQAMATVSDQRWKVVGVGDFDADGKSDLLWRHTATGAGTVWRSGRADTTLPVATAPLQWSVVGVGDFDGDRKDDIAWRNTINGANLIWLSANSGTPRAVAAVPDPAWTIATVGDYNGDGRSDLVWVNGKTFGTFVWYSADSKQAKSLGVTASGWVPAR